MSRIYRPRGPVVTREAPLPSADLLREVALLERRRVVLEVREALSAIPDRRGEVSYSPEWKWSEAKKVAMGALDRIEADDRA